MTEQEQVDSMLVYLEKHGQYIRSVNLQGSVEDSQQSRPTLRQLPPDSQLRSMHLNGFKVQLLPGAGFRGVLGAAAMVAALTQLCINDCEPIVIDGEEGLELALSQLPGFQFLIITLKEYGHDQSAVA
jgi:hypothetical protein